MTEFDDRVAAARARREALAGKGLSAEEEAPGLADAAAREAERRAVAVLDIAGRVAAVAEKRADIPMLRYFRRVRDVRVVGRILQKELPFERRDVLGYGWPLQLHREEYVGDVGKGSYTRSERMIRLSGLALLVDGVVSTYAHSVIWTAESAKRPGRALFPAAGLDLEVRGLEVGTADELGRCRILPRVELAALHDEIMDALAAFVVDYGIDSAALH